MDDEAIDAEYSAAKDEFERAEAALARARSRLNQAAHEACKAFDRRCAEARARVAGQGGKVP
jgi:hypothetical protein